MSEATKNFIRAARAVANVRASNDAAVVKMMQARMVQLQADIDAAQARANASEAIARGIEAGADELLGEPPLTVIEHLISCAYPGSVLADKYKAPNGCWLVDIGEITTVCETYQAALDVVKAAGTAPGCWSKDHPLNAKFAEVA